MTKPTRTDSTSALRLDPFLTSQTEPVTQSRRLRVQKLSAARRRSCHRAIFGIRKVTHPNGAFTVKVLA
jgi:hypothetical protein